MLVGCYLAGSIPLGKEVLIRPRLQAIYSRSMSYIADMSLVLCYPMSLTAILRSFRIPVTEFSS